ncbi:MAG: DNA methyltransferase, partial [Thermodesulfobacteriota bacterium]
YKFIQEKIKEYGLNSSHWILDPFVGCGTTVVVAKEIRINSIGIEAHPFVYEIAKTKSFWEYDLNRLTAIITGTKKP